MDSNKIPFARTSCPNDIRGGPRPSDLSKLTYYPLTPHPLLRHIHTLNPKDLFRCLTGREALVPAPNKVRKRLQVFVLAARRSF